MPRFVQPFPYQRRPTIFLDFATTKKKQQLYEYLGMDRTFHCVFYLLEEYIQKWN